MLALTSVGFCFLLEMSRYFLINLTRRYKSINILRNETIIVIVKIKITPKFIATAEATADGQTDRQTLLIL